MKHMFGSFYDFLSLSLNLPFAFALYNQQPVPTIIIRRKFDRELPFPIDNREIRMILDGSRANSFRRRDLKPLNTEEIERDKLINTESFFPMFDFFNKNEEHEKNEGKERRMKPQVNKAVKTIRLQNNRNISRQNTVDDIKKKIEIGSGKKLLHFCFYMGLLAIVAAIFYQLGKKSESENYIRVLQPEQ
ncbi:hypothetical protein NUSPORA_02802 [Nucleospora cyclopteri]